VASAPNVIADTNPPVAGLRADQPTSLAQALAGASALLPAPLPAQKDYIILITDNFSDASITRRPPTPTTAAAPPRTRCLGGHHGRETSSTAPRGSRPWWWRWAPRPMA
jgi:hypothetical protein